MKSFFKTTFLFFGIVLFFLPTPAAARVLGMSNGKLDLEIKSNNRAEQSVSLIRSHPDRDDEYKVIVEGEAAKYIDIGGQQLITLPRGQQTFVFVYTIDTAMAPLGKYNGTITFEPTGSVKAEDGSLAIRFSVTATVILNVVDEDEQPLLPVNATENPGFLNQIDIRNFTSAKSKYKIDEEINLNWQILNGSEQVLDIIPYKLQVSSGGVARYSSSGSFRRQINPRETLDQQEVFKLRLPGKYSAQITVGDQVEQVEFIVKKDWKQSATTATLIILALLLIGLGIKIIVKPARQDKPNKGKTVAKSGKSAYSGKRLFIVVVLILLGTLIIWAVSVVVSPPKLVEAELSNTGIAANKGNLLVIDDRAAAAFLFDLPSGKTQSFEGEWDFFSSEKDRLFALQTDNEQENKATRLFKITNPDIFVFDLVDLPGPIQQISENFNKTYLLIEGVNSDNNQPYFCLVDSTEYKAVECRFIRQELSEKVGITGAIWDSQVANLLNLETADGGALIYDVWMGTAEPTETEFLQPENYNQSAGNIIGTFKPSQSWFDYVYEFNNQKKYRLPFKADFAELGQGLYLMTRQKEAGLEVYVVDTANGTYRLLGEYSSGSVAVQLMKGMLSTSPLINER